MQVVFLPVPEQYGKFYHFNITGLSFKRTVRYLIIHYLLDIENKLTDPANLYMDIKLIKPAKCESHWQTKDSLASK